MFMGVVLSVGLMACTSSTDGDDGGCADVTGNYKVTTTKESGDCTTGVVGGKGESTFAITKTDTDFTIVIPNVEGGCPATLDAATCRFKSECRFFDKTNPDKTIGTLTVDYTFSGPKVSGSLVLGMSPPAHSPACTEAETHDGARL